MTRGANAPLVVFLSLEMLKKDISYLIGKERAEGKLKFLTVDYISRVLNVPLEDVEMGMKEMRICPSLR